MNVFAIASISIEREVLIRSELIESLDCIDQFDTEIIRNSPILSKIPEPENMVREKPLTRGHSNSKVSPRLISIAMYCTLLHVRPASGLVTNRATVLACEVHCSQTQSALAIWVSSGPHFGKVTPPCLLRQDLLKCFSIGRILRFDFPKLKQLIDCFQMR